MIFGLPLEIAVIIMIIAFFAEYVDSTLGMGYGTILTPLLMLLFGFEPLQIVPAILLSELITGILAGFTHHSVGNVTFFPKKIRISHIIANIRNKGFKESIKRGVPIHLKITVLLALCSIVGTVISVIVAINIPGLFLKIYIGLLIVSIGIAIIMIRKEYTFSWKKLIGLGLIASFNKGMSGGGYGPVVTGGQLLSGVESRSAVGITSLAEGLTCLVGVIVYLCCNHIIDWKLAPFLIFGGVMSVPLSVVTVKIVSSKNLKTSIGIISVILGTIMLSRL